MRNPSGPVSQSQPQPQPHWQGQPQPQWQGQWQPPKPRPAKDPTAWRAAVFAAALGAPVTALTGLTMLIEALIRGTCAQDTDPGQVCGGLPDGGVYAGLYGCVLAFGGSLTLVLVLNRVGQRAWRWLWAAAAVLLPLAIMAVAIGVGHKS